MRFSCFASGVYLTTLFPIGYSLPPNPSSDVSILSQAESSSLNAGVPSAFKVDVLTNTDIPVDPEKIWRTAIEMMFQVTDFATTETWLDEFFPSPIGNAGIYLIHNSFGKDPSRLTTQHIIWGLNHLMLSMLLSKKYCQTVATLKWEGVAIGALHVAPERQLALERNVETNRTAPRGLDRTGEGLSHFFDRDVSIRGVVYSTKPVEEHFIYLTAIKAMGDAAETGLDTPVPKMLTIGIQRVSWKLKHAVESQVWQLKAGHSRIAVYRTLAKMVHDQRFMEIYVIMDLAGDDVAIGGFNQGLF
ncbi:MAG: hypothetical protein Q9221_005487 [Calogaya cf. arnoldii]